MRGLLRLWWPGHPAAAREVTPESRLEGDLGFDSLMFTELSAALEAAGVPLPRSAISWRCATVDDLRKVVQPSSRRRGDRRARRRGGRPRRRGEGERRRGVPSCPMCGRGGQRAARPGAERALRRLFDMKVTGQPFMPQNRNFLVVANHASHLDMGLVKVALGEQGESLVALAARDYFFDTAAQAHLLRELHQPDPHGSPRLAARVAAARRRVAHAGQQPAHLPRGHPSPRRRDHGVQAHRSATSR